MKRLSKLAIRATAVLCVLTASVAVAQVTFITVASTTSTEQSGLFKHLLPLFTKATGIEVRVVALGTGQALDLARRGDADIAFVHDIPAEEKFVAEGFGVERKEVMYNDFVVAGPRDDPAKARGSNIVKALDAIYAANAPFVSRGDKSGTHAAELRYWTLAQKRPSEEKPNWYRETGSGMGPALNTAAAMNAYILSDRGTWLAFKNRQQLTILIEGDKQLFNQYGVIRVSAQKHPHVKTVAAQAFVDWLISQQGQQAIADYKIEGQQLFFPNAMKK